MRLVDRAQQLEKPGKAIAALRIAATVSTLIVVPAVLHALVPTTLAVLQGFLDVCQVCVSILRF